MSLFGTLDRSTSSPVVSKIGSRSLLAFLCLALASPIAPIQPQRRSFHQRASKRPVKPVLASPPHMDNIFIQALVRAGSCHQHAQYTSAWKGATPFSTAHHKSRRKSNIQDRTRGFRTEKTDRNTAGGSAEISQEEFKSLVDYYYTASAPLEPAPEIKLDEIWQVEKSHEPWPPGEEHDRYVIQRLCSLLEDEESPHEEIFSYYQQLPYPRVSYLTLPTIRLLLHHLAIVERRDEVSMQRYLSILDDMKAANISITKSEWSTAITFAGRCLNRVTQAEVKSALYIWREMEQEAGVEGTYVTFNILFDIAVRAGKFQLAEMFMKEMEARNLRFSRYFRTSLMLYYGRRQDGDGVRRAYRELVEAGEIVDTAVMNAVIASLIRAGEPAAAEHVFARMKALHAAKTGTLPPRPWRAARKLGKRLDFAARRLSASTLSAPAVEAERARLQRGSPIAPNAQTFSLLVRHHAVVAGNLDRVTELLDELRGAGLAPDGTVFLALLAGFEGFGGVRYSSWTRARLEDVWADFLAALDARLQGVYLSRAIVAVALRAFAKCAGPVRTLLAWEEMRRRWEPGAEELEGAVRVLRRLVPESYFRGGEGDDGAT
jgi:pentatricopeptide repeat protein